MDLNIGKVVASYEEKQEKYIYDTLYYNNFKVVHYNKIKTESLQDFIIGDFFFFMTWFIKFCSVKPDYWPSKPNDGLSKRIATYIYQQFGEFKKSKNKLELRFICEYIKHIKIGPLKNKSLDRIRSAMREYMVYQKKEFVIQYEDALQRVVQDIVKQSFTIYERIQDIQTVETNEGFVNHYHIFPDERQLINQINSNLNKLYKVVKSIDGKKYNVVKSPRKFQYRGKQLN